MCVQYVPVFQRTCVCVCVCVCVHVHYACYACVCMCVCMHLYAFVGSRLSDGSSAAEIVKICHHTVFTLHLQSECL